MLFSPSLVANSETNVAANLRGEKFTLECMLWHLWRHQLRATAFPLDELNCWQRVQGAQHKLCEHFPHQLLPLLLLPLLPLLTVISSLRPLITKVFGSCILLPSIATRRKFSVEPRTEGVKATWRKSLQTFCSTD